MVQLGGPYSVKFLNSTSLAARRVPAEHHAHGETDEETGEYTEDLAAQMLATTLGVGFDPNIAWKEREQVFKMAGKIVRTLNITQSAIGKPNRWTTVIALAVFIPEENISKRRR
jgi:arginine decarboxylase